MNQRILAIARKPSIFISTAGLSQRLIEVRAAFWNKLRVLGFYAPLLTMYLIALPLLSMSRIGLMLWQSERVATTGIWPQLLLQGLRAAALFLPEKHGNSSLNQETGRRCYGDTATGSEIPDRRLSRRSWFARLDTQFSPPWCPARLVLSLPGTGSIFLFQ